MTGVTRVFWLDTDYDRANSSNGVSRYAAYVAHAASGFTEDVDWYDRPAAAVAARAFNTACPPVMAPGFVAWHPRVLAARACRDDWAGDLLVTVDLVSDLPGPVAQAAGWSWKSWQYSEWSERFDGPELRQPGHKALLPTVSALVLIAPASVLSMPTAGVPGWRVLARAVERICQVLNGELGPIVAALDGGGS